ncbi:uncharacterized protein TrAFT101_002862 [Trichoderma asperellum]|uniref:uncharacterized protein n=1 Tax=Trichoderma asperellum TaxID=101201 RepID=UPI003333773D|nr:hypothetical protein TrAFT101_002862 [Trichoderma asperellum]
MTSPWVSAIFCLLSDCRVGQIPGAHPGYGAIPSKDALVRASCIDLTLLWSLWIASSLAKWRAFEQPRVMTALSKAGIQSIHCTCTN